MSDTTPGQPFALRNFQSEVLDALRVLCSLAGCTVEWPANFEQGHAYDGIRELNRWLRPKGMQANIVYNAENLPVAVTIRAVGFDVRAAR